MPALYSFALFAVAAAATAAAERQKRAVVLGAGGFIGGHLAKKLQSEGYWVRGVDIKRHEFFDPSPGDEFIVADLRDKKAVEIVIDDSIDEVYQLAADMGGAGYINSGLNDANVVHNSLMINLNVADVCSNRPRVSMLFFSSSACVYPEHNQLSPDDPNSDEMTAYPAEPDSEYGWEKLFAERVFQMYERNKGTPIKIARFHNIFGPMGTWAGGKEKAPAAMMRKVAAVPDGGEIEMWGDGKQTRSFIFIEDCVDGVLRLLFSDLAEPINLGSDELISMNDFATMIMQFRKDGPLPIKHLEGPLGVRGRNSNNDFIKEKLGWAPSIPVKVGIEKTYRWIEAQIEKEVAAGAKMTDYVSSKIVVQSTESLDKLNDAVPPTNGAYPSTNGKH